MSRRRQETNWSARYGVTGHHFEIFRATAAARKWIILLRGGKQAAVPWIEKGLPAKPIFLKAKVDPELGLLRAQKGSDEMAAFHHLCYVVKAADSIPRQGISQNPKALIAYNPSHPTLKGFEIKLGEWPYSEIGAHKAKIPGLILHGDRRVPFTSDYDLGAVIDVSRGLSSGLRVDIVPSYQFSFQKNLTSGLLVQAAAELNRRMMEPTGNVWTSPRVMHGAQAQYAGTPADRDNEVMLVFYPNSRVESFAAHTVADARKELEALVEQFSRQDQRGA